ncbi:MAG: tryptophan synthase subunit alpha [Rubrobacteraceae bacterium]
MSEKLGISSAFGDGRVALMPYLTGGYPSLEGAKEVGEAYIEAGADILEIGVPFSDPLADGPVVQGTTKLALENGADLEYCLELASGFAGRVPVAFLIYYNVIFSRGVERFLAEASDAGVSGLIIPDLPMDESGEFSELSAKAGVSFCPMAAPTSTDSRLDEIGAAATGFVYCVSVAGVTGARGELPPGAVELLRRVKGKTSAPAALGFGIGSPETAAEAAREADGVIIGSKLMEIVEEGGPRAAGEWLGRVRGAMSESSSAGARGRHP